MADFNGVCGGYIQNVDVLDNSSWNCFASQKLQFISKAMEPKASFVHFQVKFNILIRNQMSSLVWESAYEAFDYQLFLIIIDELLLICWFTVTLSVE